MTNWREKFLNLDTNNGGNPDGTIPLSGLTFILQENGGSGSPTNPASSIKEKVDNIEVVGEAVIAFQDNSSGLVTSSNTRVSTVTGNTKQSVLEPFITRGNFGNTNNFTYDVNTDTVNFDGMASGGRATGAAIIGLLPSNSNTIEVTLDIISNASFFYIFFGGSTPNANRVRVDQNSGSFTVQLPEGGGSQSLIIANSDNTAANVNLNTPFSIRNIVVSSNDPKVFKADSSNTIFKNITVKNCICNTSDNGSSTNSDFIDCDVKNITAIGEVNINGSTLIDSVINIRRNSIIDRATLENCIINIENNAFVTVINTNILTGNTWNVVSGNVTFSYCNNIPTGNGLIDSGNNISVTDDILRDSINFPVAIPLNSELIAKGENYTIIGSLKRGTKFDTVEPNLNESSIQNILDIYDQPRIKKTLVYYGQSLALIRELKYELGINDISIEDSYNISSRLTVSNNTITVNPGGGTGAEVQTQINGTTPAVGNFKNYIIEYDITVPNGGSLFFAGFGDPTNWEQVQSDAFVAGSNKNQLLVKSLNSNNGSNPLIIRFTVFGADYNNGNQCVINSIKVFGVLSTPEPFTYMSNGEKYQYGILNKKNVNSDGNNRGNQIGEYLDNGASTPQNINQESLDIHLINNI